MVEVMSNEDIVEMFKTLYYRVYDGDHLCGNRFKYFILDIFNDASVGYFKYFEYEHVKCWNEDDTYHSVIKINDKFFSARWTMSEFWGYDVENILDTLKEVYPKRQMIKVEVINYE